MARLHCLFSVLALTLLMVPTSQAQETTDETQLRELVEGYIVGWREADTERLRDVFDEAGHILWVSTNADAETLNARTFADVLKRRKKQPEYGLDWEILNLDIVDGKLAVAKVHISRKGGSYIDFLVCQRIDDQWRIVNKTFVVR